MAKREDKTRLPLKLLVTTIVLAFVALVAIVSLAWVHRNARESRALLDAAATAERAGEWSAAESSLRRYLRLRGDDSAICRRIGQTIERGAVNTADRLRAVPFYAKALRLEPDNDDVRICFAELQLDTNPRESLVHADAVLNRDARNPDALRIRALALVRLTPKHEVPDSRLTEVFETIADTLERQPAHIQLACQFAEFGRQHTDRLATVLSTSPEEITRRADDAMDRMVREAEDKAEARMARFLYRRKHCPVNFEGDVLFEDLRELVALKPSSSVVRLLAAGMATRRAFSDAPWRTCGKPVDDSAVRQATQHLRAAIENHPDNGAAYLSLAQLQWWCGERESATKTLAEGLDAGDPNNLILNLRLAETLIAVGEWTEAAERLRRLDAIVDKEPTEPLCKSPALAMGPVVDILWVQWQLGVDNPSGDADAALSLLGDCEGRDLSPGMRALKMYLRGRCFAAAGRWEMAAKEFSGAAQATRHTALPRLAHARALFRLGRFHEAATQYRRAIAMLERAPEDTGANQVWVEMARCCLAEQSLRPAWRRDWRGFQEALATVRRELAGSPIPLFLELEAALLREAETANDQACDRLRDAKTRFAEHPVFWEMLARYSLHAGQISTANEAVTTLENITGVKAIELRAEVALADGKFTLADGLLAEASRNAGPPERRAYLTRRVDLALRVGRTDDARWLLKRWIDEHPGDVMARFQLAQVAWSRGDGKRIAGIADELREREGEDGRLWRLCRVQALFLQSADGRDHDVAAQLVEDCDELVSRFPNDKMVRLLEGLIAEQRGEYTRAIRVLRTAMQYGAKDANVSLRLASLLHTSGQSRQALDICLTVARGNESLRAATLATRILATGSVDETCIKRAEALFSKTLAAGSKEGFSAFLLNLAVLREHQDRFDDAISLSRWARELCPAAAALKNNLAWFLSAYGNAHDEALELIDQAIDNTGPIPTLLDTKAVILLGAGRPHDSIRLLERVVQVKDAPATRYLHLAEAYWMAGRHSDARSTLEKAETKGLHALPPRDRDARLQLKADLTAKSA